MSVRLHRDPRARRKAEVKVRKRALHKHRSGFHVDRKRKEEKEWHEEVEQQLPDNLLKG